MRVPGTRAFLAILPLFGCGLRAAYAPIPDVEKGKLLTAYASVGAYYDTNIFGSPDDKSASWVYQVSPTIAVNHNPDKQTLLSLGYRVEWSHFSNRPGGADLFSHQITGRAARTFSPRFDGELNALYGISRNPESLLPGAQVLSRDQSRRDHETDFRVRYVASPRLAYTVRGKGARFMYEQAGLAEDLNRTEYLTAAAASYLALPRLQVVGEHRGQWVRYRTDGGLKDKDSHLLLGGLDYSFSRTLSVTSRFGGEWRKRSEGSLTRPYGEFGFRWDYAKQSFVSIGYAYVTDEIANLQRYNDATMHRVFLNAQHAFTPKLIASLSLLIEPTTLNGRRDAGGDIGETNRRAGAALLYKFSRRWDARITWDVDHVSSEDSVRRLERVRTGIATRYAF